MKAIQFDSVGRVDVLTLRDLPQPSPSADEVLIRVEAASVNFSDIMWRRGDYDVQTPLPFIPDAEVAGTIEAVEPGVTGYTIGMQVVSAPPSGGLLSSLWSRLPQPFRFPMASARLKPYP